MMLAGSKSTRTVRRIWLKPHGRRGAAAHCGVRAGGGPGACGCLFVRFCQAERAAARLERLSRSRRDRTEPVSRRGLLRTFTVWRSGRAARYVSHRPSWRCAPAMLNFTGASAYCVLAERERARLWLLSSGNLVGDRPCDGTREVARHFTIKQLSVCGEAIYVNLGYVFRMHRLHNSGSSHCPPAPELSRCAQYGAHPAIQARLITSIGLARDILSSNGGRPRLWGRTWHG